MLLQAGFLTCLPQQSLCRPMLDAFGHCWLLLAPHHGRPAVELLRRLSSSWRSCWSKQTHHSDRDKHGKPSSGLLLQQQRLRMQQQQQQGQQTRQQQHRQQQLQHRQQKQEDE